MIYNAGHGFWLTKHGQKQRTEVYGIGLRCIGLWPTGLMRSGRGTAAGCCTCTPGRAVRGWGGVDRRAAPGLAWRATEGPPSPAVRGAFRSKPAMRKESVAPALMTRTPLPPPPPALGASALVASPVGPCRPPATAALLDLIFTRGEWETGFYPPTSCVHGKCSEVSRASECAKNAGCEILNPPTEWCTHCLPPHLRTFKTPRSTRGTQKCPQTRRIF